MSAGGDKFTRGIASLSRLSMRGNSSRRDLDTSNEESSRRVDFNSTSSPQNVRHSHQYRGTTGASAINNTGLGIVKKNPFASLISTTPHQDIHTQNNTHTHTNIHTHTNNPFVSLPPNGAITQTHTHTHTHTYRYSNNIIK
eukprot:GHVR01001522.1.p1 GENE.GHVR01001522.1~~GHVR01001522.1.p1  ORF type:complete len:141 (-),score=58.71 GHVR01001522.1:91-513(-)